MSGTAGSPARPERRLLLIRHGQTEFNKAGRMQGQLDTPLSDAGRDEAIRVAEGLADWPIGTVVSSDLERAVDTAAALAGALFPEARQFTTDPRLRETDLGEWSGRAHEDVDASFPGARSHWRLNPRWAPPGGETRLEVSERAAEVVTELMASENLPTPTCLKDLADPVYAGQVAVTDIQSSSTAWLLIQALVDAYGEDGAEETLAAIYDNCGAHIETSGSGPLKLCRAGEVAIGFGLRHQAVADKADGLPIDYVDPTEGNFSLTESVAVLDKGEDTNPLAMEMAQCIIENGRAELIQTYPNPLYEGETADPANQSAYPSVFDEPLTFELFTAHQELSERAKG